MKRGIVFGAVLAMLWVAAMGTVNLRQYTTQEALNKLLGARPTEYTMQEGLNVILTKPAAVTDLPTTFVWSWDDGSPAWVDSLSIYTTSATYTGQAQKGTVFAHAGLFINEANSSGEASGVTAADLRTLYDAGWDINSHSYWGDNNPWGQFSGPIGTGAFEAGYDSVTSLIRMGSLAITDTLGFPRPRGWSSPGTSSQHDINNIVAQYHDYAITLSTYASGNSERHTRPEQVYEYTGVNTGPYVTAFPGIAPDRYNIPITALNSLTYKQFRDRVLRAVAFKGSLVLFTGHSPEVNAEYGFPPSDTTYGSPLRIRVAFIDSLVNEGLLQVKTMNEAFDLYWNTPISGTANRIYPEIKDRDGDNKLDLMYWPDVVSDRGVLDFYPDSVYSDATGGNIVSGSYNYGYGGHGYYTIEKRGNPWPDDQKDAIYHPSYRNNYPQWVYPLNARGGDTGIFEFFVQIDTNLTGGVLPSAADSIGVMVAHTYDIWAGDYTANQQAGGASWDTELLVDEYTPMPNGVIGWDRQGGVRALGESFGTSDTLAVVGSYWKYYTARWRIPAEADKVHISLWKDINFPAHAVRISNISFRIDPASGRW